MVNLNLVSVHCYTHPEQKVQVLGHHIVTFVSHGIQLFSPGDRDDAA